MPPDEWEAGMIDWTMTVGELREKLSGYSDDMPVWAAWEGVLGYVRPQNFVIEQHQKGSMKKRDCLVIDVEGY